MTGYGDGELSDTRIAAMSPAERRDLIQRLQRPRDEVFPPIGETSLNHRYRLRTGGTLQRWGLCPSQSRRADGTGAGSRSLYAHPAQPSCRRVIPSFQILVMWRILSPSKSMT